MTDADGGAPRLLFLLSLPRSGSTLVQRVLARHPTVGTAAEPWMALPPAMALQPDDVAAAYNHVTLSKAVNHFVQQLPGGADAYRRRWADLLTDMYAEVAPGRDWFVDKTPRYALVVDELARTFPDALFVFLWRNPLAVVASLADSYRVGWFPYRHRVDIYTGLERLTAAALDLGDRAVHLTYESLVTSADAWQPLFDRMGIPFDPALTASVDEVVITGPVGDPTQATYASVSNAPLTKWHDVFVTPGRRRWARGYLAWIGPDRLGVMGQAHDELLAELDALSTRWSLVPRDVVASLRQRAYAGRQRWRAGAAIHGGSGPLSGPPGAGR